MRSKRASIEKMISLDEADDITMCKDQVKEGRGAKIIGKIADINFNNSEGGHRENILKFEKIFVF